MKKALLFLLFIIGLLLFLTPFIRKEYTDYTFKKKSEEIQKKMEQLSEDTRENKRVQEAIKKNSDVMESLEEKKMSFQSVNGKDEVGYLIIPRINQTLPLFSGATDEHLANGVAQITGTSLPMEGIGSNTVIAGHRGYYGALIFRNLDQLENGDLVYVNYFGEEGIYKMISQSVIVPTDNEKLESVEGKDLLTLFTCHPYPQNSHRLIIQAERLNITDNNAKAMLLDKYPEEKTGDFFETKKSILPRLLVLCGILFSLYFLVRTQVCKKKLYR